MREPAEDAANLFERLRSVAARQPDRLALQIKDATGYRALTYGELVRQARLLAGALVRAGLAPGDRVALISENRPEWAVAYFAVAAAGGTAVPLDVQLGDAEVANVLRHAGCRMAVGSGAQIPRLLAVGTDAALLAVVVDLDADRDGQRTLAFRRALDDPALAQVPLPRVDRGALASILYTSGTTGVPKGVMLSHGNFLANVESVLKFRLINAEDNLLSVLPLHHAFPFTVQLILLFTGARITFPASLKGPDLLACMHETGVTALVAVPQLFYLLHKGIFEQIGRRPPLVRFLLRLLLRLSGALRPAGINLGRLCLWPGAPAVRRPDPHHGQRRRSPRPDHRPRLPGPRLHLDRGVRSDRNRAGGGLQSPGRGSCPVRSGCRSPASRCGSSPRMPRGSARSPSGART